MTETPERYQLLRSHADLHDFVLCYADRFYADVPYHVCRREGVEWHRPWRRREAAQNVVESQL